MVKKNKTLEKNDNEIKKLSEAIKSLNNNNIFKIYNSTKKILLISFLKGLASGLGWIIGATILVSLLTYILSQIEFIPILGDIVSQLIKEIEAFDR
tara:strand:+ start:207 stop:494 length:288 start_codon:yes stop_codon:yes gene_type:complete